MSKPIIAIVGLGLRGTSLGLALQQEDGNFEVVGHDKEPQAAANAKKLKAVHRTEWNLHRACEGADMLVLTLPLSELEVTLDLVREDVKPETLILAIVNVMQPAVELATKHLSPETHFVAAHPVLTGVGGALTPRADLYKNITFCLAPGVETDASVVQLASDFVERVGATPLFVDAAEHDGIIAGVEQLPQLMAAVLMQSSSTSPGWQEARRLAGRPFAQATGVEQSAEQLFGAFLANRRNLLLHIERLQRDLAQWRAFVELDPLLQDEEDEHPLLTALKEVHDARERWAAQALLQNWEETQAATSQEESRGLLQQMFFGNMFGGRGRKSAGADNKRLG